MECQALQLPFGRCRCLKDLQLKWPARQTSGLCWSLDLCSRNRLWSNQELIDYQEKFGGVNLQGSGKLRFLKASSERHKVLLTNIVSLKLFWLSSIIWLSNFIIAPRLYNLEPNIKCGETDPNAAMENKNIPHAIHLGRWPRPAKYVRKSDVHIWPISLKFSSSAIDADLMWKSFSIVVMTLTK